MLSQALTRANGARNIATVDDDTFFHRSLGPVVNPFWRWTDGRTSSCHSRTASSTLSGGIEPVANLAYLFPLLFQT